MSTNETERQTSMRWTKATGHEEFECGDSYLVAVPVRSRENANVKYWWEYNVITATETGWDINGDSGWGWDWTDVEWYIPCKSMSPASVAHIFNEPSPPAPAPEGEADDDLRDFPVGKMTYEQLEIAAGHLSDEVKRLKSDHDIACKTVAAMHAAAVGEVRGLAVGVVEDVRNARELLEREIRELRAECEELEAKAAKPTLDIFNRVCRDLPDDFRIVIDLERDSGTVELLLSGDEVDEFADDEGSMEDRIMERVQWAIGFVKSEEKTEPNIMDLSTLPELTTEQRAAMNSLPSDLIERLWNEETTSSPSPVSPEGEGLDFDMDAMAKELETCGVTPRTLTCIGQAIYRDGNLLCQVHTVLAGAMAKGPALLAYARRLEAENENERVWRKRAEAALAKEDPLVDQLRSTVSKLEGERDAAQRELANERNRLIGENGIAWAGKSAAERRVAELTAELKTLRDQLGTVSADRTDYRDRLNEYKAKLARSTEELAAARSQIGEIAAATLGHLPDTQTTPLERVQFICRQLSEYHAEVARLERDVTGEAKRADAMQKSAEANYSQVSSLQAQLAEAGRREAETTSRIRDVVRRIGVAASLAWVRGELEKILATPPAAGEGERLVRMLPPQPMKAMPYPSEEGEGDHIGDANKMVAPLPSGESGDHANECCEYCSNHQKKES